MRWISRLKYSSVGMLALSACWACSDSGTNGIMIPTGGGAGTGGDSAMAGGAGASGGAISAGGTGPVIIVGGAGGASGADGSSGSGGNCVGAHTLKALVRDFRGVDGFSDEPGHADFEGMFNGHKGIVQPALGADSKPVYAGTGPTIATTGPAEFDQWYRDVAGVNQTFEVELPLMADAARPGYYVFDDQEFFPIDGQGFGDGFGGHNFHFTTEIHIEFSYQGGEVFTFRGDDDVFTFINGKLAIDLGGVHPAELASVVLDERAAELGIERGKTYRMDIFHAERHTEYSTFRIETTLRCIKNIDVPR